MTTCAICGWRDSVDTTDWDGRDVPACGVCLEPPDIPDGYEYEPADLVERFDPMRAKREGVLDHSSRDAVYAVVSGRPGGATTDDVLKELGVSGWRTREYDVVTNHLRLLVRSGCLTFTEVSSHRFAGQMVRCYHAAKRPEPKMHVPRSTVVELTRQGMPPRKIAERLGAKVTAIKAALIRARKRGELPIQRAA